MAIFVSVIVTGIPLVKYDKIRITNRILFFERFHATYLEVYQLSTNN